MYEQFRDGLRLEKPKNCPNEMYNLMKICWQFDPEERPVFHSIFGIINSLMMKVNGGYIRMDSNASEKKTRKEHLPKFDFQTNQSYKGNANEVNHYVNLSTINQISSNGEKSNYVDMRGKIK